LLKEKAAYLALHGFGTQYFRSEKDIYLGKITQPNKTVKKPVSDSLNYILNPMINQVTIQTGVRPLPYISYRLLLNESGSQAEVPFSRTAVGSFLPKKSGLFSM